MSFSFVCVTMIPSLHSAVTWPVYHTRKNKEWRARLTGPVAHLSTSGGIPSGPGAFPFLSFFMAPTTSSRVGSSVCMSASLAAVADFYIRYLYYLIGTASIHHHCFRLGMLKLFIFTSDSLKASSESNKTFETWIELSSLNNKSSDSYNFSTATLIMTEFLHGIATMNGHSWLVLRLPPTNPRWQTVAIFNFVQELCYRKQIARQLCRQCVDSIYWPKYYTVTLKSRLRVTQGHWKRNHWIDLTQLTISYLTLNIIVTLKCGLEVTQGHWKWYHLKAWVRFPIRLPLAVSLAISGIFSVKEWPDLEKWVWGCSRSLKMAQFDIPCMTFY